MWSYIRKGDLKMAEVKKIKKSQNYLQLSGVLLETNLKLEEGVKGQAWSNKDGKMKDLTCDVIKKKEKQGRSEQQRLIFKT